MRPLADEIAAPSAEAVERLEPVRVADKYVVRKTRDVRHAEPLQRHHGTTLICEFKGRDRASAAIASRYGANRGIIVYIIKMGVPLAAVNASVQWGPDPANGFCAAGRSCR